MIRTLGYKIAFDKETRKLTEIGVIVTNDIITSTIPYDLYVVHFVESLDELFILQMEIEEALKQHKIISSIFV